MQYSFKQNFKNVTNVVLISGVHSVATFAVLTTRTRRVARWIFLQCYVWRTDTQAAIQCGSGG